MEDERIKVVKLWLEPKSVKDIQAFFGFAHFYWQFIQGFSRIAISLISIQKTKENTGFATNLKKIESGVSGNSVAGNVVGSSEATNPIKRKNLVKTTKSKILVKSKNHDFP